MLIYLKSVGHDQVSCWDKKDAPAGPEADVMYVHM